MKNKGEEKETLASSMEEEKDKSHVVGMIGNIRVKNLPTRIQEKLRDKKGLLYKDRTVLDILTECEDILNNKNDYFEYHVDKTINIYDLIKDFVLDLFDSNKKFYE